MTDAKVASAVAAPAMTKSPYKKKVAASKRATATHPTTAVMIIAAVTELHEKKGSSLPAIKKYLAANFKVDPGKLALFIRKSLKAAVANGILVQTKGTGAAGLFKLAAEARKPAIKKSAAKKPKIAAAGAPKKKAPVAKATKSEPAVKKAKKAAKPKASTAKPAKSPAKTKKAPATKTKPPVAKKLPAKKTAAPKKK